MKVGRVLLGGLLVLIPVAVLCAFALSSNGFLLWTIHHGYRSLARTSLTLGADPNAKRNSQSALMEAASWGYPDIVEALLARGAAIDAVDDAHRQALHYAARNGEEDGGVVRVLLEHGANPVGSADGGVTPLMRSASGMSGGTVMGTLAMIAYADDVNQQDVDGNTALYFATGEAKIEVVRALLRAGANPNLPNHKGELPITMAAREQVDRVQLLLSFGADPNLKIGNAPSAMEIVKGAAPNPQTKAAFQ